MSTSAVRLATSEVTPLPNGKVGDTQIVPRFQATGFQIPLLAKRGPQCAKAAYMYGWGLGAALCQQRNLEACPPGSVGQSAYLRLFPFGSGK